MLPSAVDAIVIGGGPNGLVSAALLADAGWSVLLLEAADELGGAVRSRREDGWTMDRFSACYPLAVSSPVMAGLGLEKFGLTWAHADPVLVHPAGPDDEVGAVIFRDREQTAALLADECEADGQVWLDLCEQWDRIGNDFLAALLTAWPPVLQAARLLRAAGGTSEGLRLARFLALPAHRMGAELFRGQRGRRLLIGNAAHSDVSTIAPVSGMMGWLLSMLAQSVGFPSPVGGADQLTAALVARARWAGAVLAVGEPVVGIGVSSGRATTVRTASGRTITAERAVIADVSVPMLYGELLPDGTVPARVRRDLGRFELDLPTVKVNYRLRETPRWTAAAARSAGVIHAGADVNGMVHWSADLETSRVPESPFAVIGQMTRIDETRSPDGTEAMWAYSHLPRGTTSAAGNAAVNDADAGCLADRMTAMIERHAPGFRELIIDSDVQTPATLESENANLVNGAIGGGTAQLFQQLVFRPIPGSGGPRTHVEDLYLGSSAIHPGAGVHGACGALAARAALADHRMLGSARRRVRSAVLERLYREPV